MIVPSTATADFGGKYTLDEKLFDFLRTNYGWIGGTLQLINNSRDQSIETIIRPLGSDFFSFNGLRFEIMGTYGAYLTANLALGKEIPHTNFRNAIKNLLGSEEAAAFFLSTDLATALGLNDPTKPINLEDQALQQYFPDISQIKKFEGKYLVPAQPYLLLLAVNPASRRFLSTCFDNAGKDMLPHSVVTGDYNTGSGIISYGFSRDLADQLVSRGILSTQTIVKTGQQYQLKDIKQYADAVANLKKQLSDLPRP